MQLGYTEHGPRQSQHRNFYPSPSAWPYSLCSSTSKGPMGQPSLQHREPPEASVEASLTLAVPQNSLTQVTWPHANRGNGHCIQFASLSLPAMTPVVDTLQKCTLR